MAIDFAALLGGALVTEIVFSWNGMGQYLFSGLTGAESPDVYAVSGWLIVASTAVVVFNILADLLYGLLDPRIRPGRAAVRRGRFFGGTGRGARCRCR